MAASLCHPKTSAFLRATCEGRTDVILSMLEEGVPVDVTNASGLQALHFAAKRGHTDLAEELLKNNADVNVPSSKGYTPIHVAALMGHSEMTKLLLHNGAKVNAQSACSGDHFSPLYMAAQIGNQEIVTLLLANGANPTQATQNGSTARDVARQQGFTVIEEILREYEKRVRIRDDAEDNDVAGSSDNKASFSPQHYRVAPSTMSQDVCASPRNSPKLRPKRMANIKQ